MIEDYVPPELELIPIDEILTAGSSGNYDEDELPLVPGNDWD